MRLLLAPPLLLVASMARIRAFSTIRGLASQYQTPHTRRGLMAMATSEEPKNLFQQIKRHSKIIADTADYVQLDSLPPVDEVTTNPTIIWQGAQQPQYFYILEQACDMYRREGKEGIPSMVEAVPFKFARETLKRLPRRVAKVYVQVDVRASFDVAACRRRALDMMQLAEAHDIPREMLVLKIPGSWEGIQAARQLESEDGVRCLITAITSITQAAAAAQAGASYVAPYVGRVSDWHRAEGNKEAGTGSLRDPGVLLARDIQTYYRAKGFATKVMAASFRNIEQIQALAGCDILTISPKLLIELECAEPAACLSPVPESMGVSDVNVLPSGAPVPVDAMDEQYFLAAVRDDECGSKVFATSMSSFLADIRKVEQRFFEYMSFVEDTFVKRQ